MAIIQPDTEKRVLITGVAGFIGFHLAARLLKRGVSVIGIDNLNSYYNPSLKESRLKILKEYNSFKFEKCDISQFDMLSEVFADSVPDIVVNLAAQAGVRYSIENPRLYIDSNIGGFFNILELCRYHKPFHLVYASSSSVYGNRQTTPFSVSDMTDSPVSLYAATKKTNELMAYTYSHLFDLSCTGLRFFTVYGPYGRPDMAYFNFTKRIIEGSPINVFNNGDMYRDFTFVDDVTQTVELVMYNPPDVSPASEVYNIGNNSPHRLSDFIAVLEDCIGVKADMRFLPMQPGDVYQTFADVDALSERFGFRPSTDLRDGLKVFVDWYKEYYG